MEIKVECSASDETGIILRVMFGNDAAYFVYNTLQSEWFFIGAPEVRPDNVASGNQAAISESLRNFLGANQRMMGLSSTPEKMEYANSIFGTVLVNGLICLVMNALNSVPNHSDVNAVESVISELMAKPIFALMQQMIVVADLDHNIFDYLDLGALSTKSSDKNA